MQRSWMFATCIVLLAACRADGTNDRALGTERAPGIASSPHDLSKAEQNRNPSAEQGALGIMRILVMTQAMDQHEIEMGALAVVRAASADIKAYAAKLANERKQNLDAMDRLTRKKKIILDVLPDDPLINAKRAANREMIEALSRLSGQAFDLAYIEGRS